MNVTELQSKSTDELAKLAKEAGLEENPMLRDELVFKLMENDAQQQGFVLAHGVLEIMPDGYGFLRQNGVRPSQGDVYVSQSQIRRFSLRTGDSVTGQVRPPKDSERYFGLIRVEGVNGQDPEKSRGRSHFDNLTPVYPTEQLSLESSSNNLAQRVIDLVAPLGRGQRALIVSPPKAGKTFLIKDIANGISSNH